MPGTLVASYQHRGTCNLYHSSTLKMVAVGFCLTLLTICLSTCYHTQEDRKVHNHCHLCLISCIRAGSQLWYRTQQCVKESSALLCCLTLWERNVYEKEVYGLLSKFCNF